jgi:hypothetical protein
MKHGTDFLILLVFTDYEIESLHHQKESSFQHILGPPVTPRPVTFGLGISQLYSRPSAFINIFYKPMYTSFQSEYIKAYGLPFCVALSSFCRYVDVKEVSSYGYDRRRQ